VKTALGIILGVLAGFITLLVILALVIFLYIVPVVRQFSTEQMITPSPAYSTAPFSSPTPKPLMTSSPVQNPALPIPANDVNFTLNIKSVSGTDLSRRITAEMINTGSIDAQNTWVMIEVFSRGKGVKVNGQDNLRIYLGTLKAGVPTTSDVTLTFSPFDVPLILVSGATFNLSLSSDQKNQTFSYDYKP
jgi:hypothetical protein